jgi:hypothetical protein
MLAPVYPCFQNLQLVEVGLRLDLKLAAPKAIHDVLQFVGFVKYENCPLHVRLLSRFDGNAENRNSRRKSEVGSPPEVIVIFIHDGVEGFLFFRLPYNPYREFPDEKLTP